MLFKVTQTSGNPGEHFARFIQEGRRVQARSGRMNRTRTPHGFGDRAPDRGMGPVGYTRAMQIRASVRSMLGSVLAPAIPLLAACVVLGLFAAGCVSRGEREIADNRPYPMELRQNGSLDIQVIQKDTTLELTNTTTQRLEGGTMWLNQRFARDVEALAPGDKREYDLDSFIDQFGDYFRPGGFWAAYTPDRIYLAQWEERVPGQAPKLIGLISVSRIDE